MPIQGRFTDALKRTRYEHKRVHGKRQQYNDYCSSKDDKASTPLDKYGQPLELPKSIPQIIMNSKFIGYVAGLLVIDRQMKMLL
jgi:hypothetical protein